MTDELMLLHLISQVLLWWSGQQERLPIDDSGKLCFDEPNFVKFAKKFAGIIERKNGMKAKMNFNCVEAPVDIGGEKIREGDPLYMNTDGKASTPKKFPPNIEIDLIVDVKGCSACGGNHEGMIFELMKTPIQGFTHQTTCPTNGISLFLSWHDYTGIHTAPLFANVTTTTGTHGKKEE